MNKGMRQIQQKLRTVDCIVEIHDARIPLAGRNSQFFETITGKESNVDFSIPNDILSYPQRQRSQATYIGAEQDRSVGHEAPAGNCEATERTAARAKEYSLY